MLACICGVYDLADPQHGRLVVFDVEGVLIPKNRYLLFEVSRELGFSAFVRIVFYGFLYEVGLISLKKALKELIKVLKGFSRVELLRIFRRIPLMPGVKETFQQLRQRGWKIALISSGLPSFAVEDLAKRLGADYAYGFSLEMADEVATGAVSGEVLEPKGKLLVLERLLAAEGLKPEDCIIVVDDRNNAPMMLPQALKIGYNPDFVIRVKADYVICGSMDKLIRLVDGQVGGVLPSRNEVVRELIHACGFTVPILAGVFGINAMALLIIAVTLLYTASEIAKLENKRIPLISWIIRHAATDTEVHEFAPAPIYFAMGILLTLLLFPARISSPVIAAFALGDSTAAIAGTAIGKRMLPFNKGKTLEGLAAGLIAGFIAALAYADPMRALIAAVVATAVEGLPLPVNDNLAIPVITAATLTLIG